MTDTGQVPSQTGSSGGDPPTGAERLSDGLPRGGGRSWAHEVGRYGTVFGLIVLCVVFALMSPVFLRGSNLLNILSASALLGLIASGLTVALVNTEFDLSIGWIATLSGMLAAGVAIDHGTAVGMLAGVAAGASVGVANGIIVTRLGVSSLIATLAMGTILQGIIYGYRRGAQITAGLPENFAWLGRGSVFGVRYLIIVTAVVMLALWALLQHTRLGRQMYAIGGNVDAARLSGIRVLRVKLVAFVISGTAAGLAGALLASNLRAGNPTAGIGFLLDAFTACFIGAATLRDGEFHITGTLVGVLIMGVLANGLVLLGVPAMWQTIAKGAVLIAAVAVSGTMRRTAAAGA